MSIGSYDGDDVRVKGVDKDFPDDNEKDVYVSADQDDNNRRNLHVTTRFDAEQTLLLKRILEQLRLLNTQISLVTEVKLKGEY